MPRSDAPPGCGKKSLSLGPFRQERVEGAPYELLVVLPDPPGEVGARTKILQESGSLGEYM